MRFACFLPLLCAIAAARKCGHACAYDKPLCVGKFSNDIPSGEKWHLVNRWATSKGCCDFWAWQCALCCDTAPTPEPSPRPTPKPTKKPTHRPTHKPTMKPTPHPTDKPTPRPTREPTTWMPSPTPTVTPSFTPTQAPTPEPSVAPTEEPTNDPSSHPFWQPTPEPTSQPTSEPTDVPTQKPTQEPTLSELEKAIKFDEFMSACSESEADSKRWACASICGAKFKGGRKGCMKPKAARKIKCKLLNSYQCGKASCSMKVDKNNHFKKCYGKSQLA